MFEFNTSLLEIAVRTFIVYVVVLVGLRIFGKRELGQMTPFDLVLILTLSNSVQNAMTGPDTTLSGGIVSAGTLLVTHWFFNRLGLKVPRVRKWLAGEPTLLVHDGQLLYGHLSREGVEPDEVLMAAREHGLDKISEIGEAMLEVDGTISIIPAGVKPLTSKRKRRVHR
ncbi:MAG: YetF domain-containing protein [Chloroflexota bacterium]